MDEQDRRFRQAMEFADDSWFADWFSRVSQDVSVAAAWSRFREVQNATSAR